MLTKVHARVSGAFRAALLTAMVTAGLASGAGAATVTLQGFDRTDIAGAQAARNGFLASHKVENLRTETFAGKPAWNGQSGSTNPQNTAVGSFASLGGIGSGGSHINGGSGLEVRGDNTMRWGRFSTSDVLGGKWLDSNDTYGMKWDIGGLGKFNSLSFFLIDAADVGAKFSIKVGETLFSQVLGAGGRALNGNIQLVTILLPQAVSHLTVELFNNRLNDGFGIDGASIAKVAPVPLPPAAALLGTGLLALGLLRRRATLPARL